MADEDENHHPRYPNLQPIQSGEVRNPTGRNGKVRVDKVREYLDEKAEPSSRHNRRENILLALYSTSIDRRRRDHVAAARVLLAYDLGLPPQALQIDHSNNDGSMLPAVIHICPVSPREDEAYQATPTEMLPNGSARSCLNRLDR